MDTREEEDSMITPFIQASSDSGSPGRKALQGMILVDEASFLGGNRLRFLSPDTASLRNLLGHSRGPPDVASPQLQQRPIPL